MMIKFIVGPFSLVVFMLAVVFFRDKKKKDLFILLGVGSLILGLVAGI